MELWNQARRQDFASVQKPQGGHIFWKQFWMYAATGGPNMTWGAQILNVVPGTADPPAGDGPA